LTVDLNQLPPACSNYSGGSRLFFAEGECEFIDVSFNGSAVTKGTLALVIAIVDIIFVVVLGLSLIVLKFLQDIDYLEMHGLVITPANFTIELRDLPPHDDINVLKAQLWEWVMQQLGRIEAENK